jgi:uncharacterized membrane protein YebE (DUF533 family)
MFDLNQIITALHSYPRSKAGFLDLSRDPSGGAPFGVGQQGALAALNGFAIHALVNGQCSRPSGVGPEAVPATMAEGVFVLPADATAAAEVTRTLVMAMVAAANADGQIEDSEKSAIFDRLDGLDLAPDLKAFVLEELNAPRDLEAVVTAAVTDALAVQIYAASILVTQDENPYEAAYLDALAIGLELVPETIQAIHRLIGV